MKRDKQHRINKLHGDNIAITKMLIGLSDSIITCPLIERVDSGEHEGLHDSVSTESNYNKHSCVCTVYIEKFLSIQ